MSPVAAVLFLLHGFISSGEILYSEIEYLGGSCYPNDSCISSRNEDEDHLWGNHTCECAEHCIRYSTCCADSPHYGKVLRIENRGEVCKKLPNTADAVIAVSRCSDRWHYGFHIREKCETPEMDIEDPFTATPVTSRKSNVTYKNYFCALCNYDSRDVHLWNISLGLKTKQTVPSLSNVTENYLMTKMSYNSEQKSWGIVVDNAFYMLKSQFKVPASLMKFVKKCYPSVISKCDASHANNFEFQYKCMSYYAPIQIKQNGTSIKKYRNIHCAMCNNVNVTDSDMNICKLDAQKPKTAKPFSFALLLDINRSDGDLVGFKRVCKDTENWDPFFKKCRSLACVLPGHVIQNGRCVAT